MAWNRIWKMGVEHLCRFNLIVWSAIDPKPKTASRGFVIGCWRQECESLAKRWGQIKLTQIARKDPDGLYPKGSIIYYAVNTDEVRQMPNLTGIEDIRAFLEGYDEEHRAVVPPSLQFFEREMEEYFARGLER